MGTSATSSDTASEPEEETDCPICGGAGFLRRKRELDDPLFGRVETCECRLQEAEDTRHSRLERLSNLGTLTRFTFETLKPEGRDASFRRNLEIARQYAISPAGWLAIVGPSGAGKTHLAAAIANERISQGQPVLFMVAADMLDRLRSSYEPEDAGELDFDLMFDQVRNAPLLILDDIDGVSQTPWAKEKLNQVVNHRYNLLLPTVFTSTSATNTLDERLATRLADEALTRVLALKPVARQLYRQVGGMTRQRLAEMNFGNFDLTGARLGTEERDSLDSAFRAAHAFAENPHGWLLLQGANGCGKTHLAAAIANRALADGVSTFFAVVPDLLDELRSGFAPGKEGAYDELFSQIRNAPLLILDDFGAQRSATWAEEKLYQVVNYRTIAELPGVITTDRSINELQSNFPRIVSRIIDPRAGNIVGILAPHYRLGRAFTSASTDRSQRRR